MDFKRDKYRKSRGNYSRVLELSCRVCKNKIANYQKDGAGNLRRMYLDRIIAPPKLANLSNNAIASIHPLRCPHCKEDLGTPYVYKKEQRKAFKVYQDAIKKKVVKLSNLTS